MAEFVSWEISVSASNLEEEQNNQLKKGGKKKKLQKVARSLWEATEPARPWGAPRTWGTPRHGRTSGWSGSDAEPDLSPATRLCRDPQPPSPAAKPNLGTPIPPWSRAGSHPGRLLPPRVSGDTACLSFPLSTRREPLGPPALPQDRAGDTASPCPRAGGPPTWAAQGQTAAFPRHRDVLRSSRLSQRAGLPQSLPFFGKGEDMHYAIYFILIFLLLLFLEEVHCF